MKRFLTLAAALIVLTSSAMARAQGASLNLTLVINGPPSTAITCPLLAPFIPPGATIPVAAGTPVCKITVTPANWSGTLSLSGTNAGLFAIAAGAGGQQIVVGPAGLTTAGTLTLTVNSAP